MPRPAVPSATGVLQQETVGGCFCPVWAQTLRGTQDPVTGHGVFRRRVRRRVAGERASANVAADVNIVVGSGGSSSSRQTVRIDQTDGAAAGTKQDEGGSAAKEEDS